jgi:hypothetical protein
VRPDRELRNLKINAGGVHARRIIERELERLAHRRLELALGQRGVQLG